MERRLARFNERITFQKNTLVVDEFRNHTNRWTDYYSCHAYASTFNDKESEGEVVKEAQTIQFEVRYCSELLPVRSTEYRIIFNGCIYDIEGIDWMNYQRKKIRISSKLVGEVK